MNKDPYAELNRAGAEIAAKYDDSVQDQHALFVMGEQFPAHFAFRRSMQAREERPLLAHFMYARVVAEVGVRLSWIARNLETTGEAGVREAIDALSKRDMIQLRQAIKALRQDTSDIDDEISRVEVKEAPATLAGLAEEAPIAAESYALHRLSSALIHPGTGMRKILGDAPDTEIRLRDAMVMCTAFASDLLAELVPETEPVDPESFSEHVGVRCIPNSGGDSFAAATAPDGGSIRAQGHECLR